MAQKTPSRRRLHRTRLLYQRNTTPLLKAKGHGDTVQQSRSVLLIDRTNVTTSGSMFYAQDYSTTPAAALDFAAAWDSRVT